MAQVPIWPGSGSLDEVTESTPYGFYDNEVLLLLLLLLIIIIILFIGILA